MTLVLFVTYVFLFTEITPPAVVETSIPKRVQLEENTYAIGDNWIRKNKQGVWEMYIEGSAYERGLTYGLLSKELCEQQEAAFVHQFDFLIPNKYMQQFIRGVIAFFNKNLNNHIPLEYQLELYGVSKSFSGKFDYIAPKYMRVLNYHAAHDIGHALNDYSLIGCSSFAVKGKKSYSNKLIIGRNFDFYVGDEFAKEKLILFSNPDSGYAYCSIGWAGFMGVVSGLNEQGLSVTINASKSTLPKGSKTPISLLAREILQYARNIEEAISIANKREVFVSESILIGSKDDGCAVVIEKSPSGIGVFKSNEDILICTNHYQSDEFKNNKINLDNIELSDSKARFDRLIELLNTKKTLSPNAAANILRDRKGLGEKNIGYGNPKSINQLIAHHSVVIEPEDLKIYFSTKDNSLGAYQGYNLDSIFDGYKIYVDPLPIDSFIYSKDYTLFKTFNRYKKRIQESLLLGDELTLTDKSIVEFTESNPHSYLTYKLLAIYYYNKDDFYNAMNNINISLTKELPSKQEETALNQFKEKIRSSKL